MRFSAAAAISAAALLAGTVNADAQSVLSEASPSVAGDASSVVESSTSAAPELPTFTVSTQITYQLEMQLASANLIQAYHH
jgi:calnexin